MNPRKTLQIFKIWNGSIWNGLNLVRRPKTHFLRFVYFLLHIQAWRHIRVLNMRLFHYVWHAQLHLIADHFLTTTELRSWCSHVCCFRIKSAHFESVKKKLLAPFPLAIPCCTSNSTTYDHLLTLDKHRGLLYSNGQSRIKYQLTEQTNRTTMLACCETNSTSCV